MKKFEKNIENRKDLVNRLCELTGARAIYTRVPRCAYEVGDFTVERDGTLVAGDLADLSIVETLIQEGMVKEQDEVVETGEATEPEEVMEPVETTEPEETTDLEETAEPEETTESVEMAEAGEQSQDPESRDLDVDISFPISQHTAASLLNLVCMVYSRGSLLSKATGGRFYASRELVDSLFEHSTFTAAGEVADFLNGQDLAGKLEGLSFRDGKVVFDGFLPRDAEHLGTFTRLASAMNGMALTQKRVNAKEVNEDNEKYALRIWLVRLGMNGSDYKEDRGRLMENLTGHTAFKTEEEKARWSAKQAAKREALKAEKTGSQAAQDGSQPSEPGEAAQGDV